MNKQQTINNPIELVSNFQELIAFRFLGAKNAVCWNRQLIGDFQEIVNKLPLNENIEELSPETLLKLQLSAQGKLARTVLLNDLKLLKNFGASPVLNLIKHYNRDDSFPFFPTDVYSYHVDRSPLPTDTFLCTYFGASSDILPNHQATQKVLVPEIRAELFKLYNGAEDGFETFLKEYFFDLHYQVKPNAKPINLGIGNMWRLTTDHPKSKALPCIHRAPIETNLQTRLMLIC